MLTEDDVLNMYWQWMMELIHRSDRNFLLKPYNSTYNQLLSKLNSTQFEYIIDKDSNRYSDGIELRYHFGYERDVPQPIIATCIDNRPCSVLEMMVALAKRCDNFMCDDESGCRIGNWFWNMISTLGLMPFNDNIWSESSKTIVEKKLQTFMNRQYDPVTGEGSLFLNIQNRPNYADVEIWYQANWYLSDFIMNII